MKAIDPMEYMELQNWFFECIEEDHEGRSAEMIQEFIFSESEIMDTVPVVCICGEIYRGEHSGIADGARMQSDWIATMEKVQTGRHGRGILCTTSDGTTYLLRLIEQLRLKGSDSRKGVPGFTIGHVTEIEHIFRW